ncbi:MAG: hypothetical protein CSA84_00640 [Actinomycetales bacterium]|nr:MAG: hypothetical protein CSA84_00640 [Actinomycetales bacterium]
MQPSSLVFVAVVAIWAAFLVQHWVRRREAMTTARSIDQFSEAMHLLDRRPVRALSEARPPAAMIAAGTAPPSRHPVVPQSPLVARGRGTAGGAAAAPSISAPPTHSGPSAGVPGAAATAAAGDGRGNRQHRHTGARRGSRPVARWARVVFLLVALGSVPTTIVLAVLGRAPWWGVAASVVAVPLAVFMLRYAAVRERTRRRFDRSMAASSPNRHTSVAGAPAASEPRRAASEHADGIPADVASAPAAVARDTTAAATSRGQRAASRSGLDGPTWNPVPVPRPTYALKPQVARRDPVHAPVPTADPVSTGTAGTEARPQPEAGEQAARRAVGD